MPKENDNFEALLKERFEKLPAVVQKAIMSADVEKHLQGLANTHQLHLDQWETLENQVQLILLGVYPTDTLQNNIKNEVGVNDDVAAALASDISKTVFEPIRQELERQLDNPNAVEAAQTSVEAARSQILTSEIAQNAPAPMPQSPAPAAPITSPAPAAVPPTPQAPAAPAAAAPLPPVAPIVPATPPPPPVTGKVERAQIPAAYAPTVPSTQRKEVAGDPYREQIDNS